MSRRSKRANRRRELWTLVFAAIAGMATWTGSAVFAGEDSNVAPPAKARLVAATSLDSADASALDFAKTHHPELGELLTRLRKDAPQDYAAAMKSLRPAYERLQRTKEKSPDRYASDVALWTLDSRIRLLTARMTMTPDPALEQELRTALGERRALQLELLRQDRVKAAQRLERLDQEIAQFESSTDAELQRLVNQARDAATRRVKATKSKPTAAEKAAAEKATPEKSSATKIDAPAAPQAEKPAPEKSRSGKLAPRSNGNPSEKTSTGSPK